VTRLAGDAPRWTAPQPTSFDRLEITGPLVLGHTADAIVALDLESGRTRFTWALPADERWGAQPPAALASCLVAITTRSGKAAVRCLDIATGAVRWTAAPAAAHDCTQPLFAVPGAYLLQCPGWTAVIDERTGAVAVEAGGITLIQDDPPYLLRARSRLTLSPWSSAKRRFTATGEIAYGAGTAATSSAVLYKDRLVMRAVESSDELAVIAPRSGPPITIAAPVYRLADARPLARSCDGTTAPRFQLLELAPRIGATFDPATAQDRALALLDVETGTLAWTSRKLAGLHAQPAAQPPICRAGHYFVPLEIADHAGMAASLLWIVDAQTGRTSQVVAFDADLNASFAGLTADQVDDQRIAGIGRSAAFELRWQSVSHGLHDARRDLEAALGPLP
jgi:outer membrane protein assembly factor BamB